MRKRLFVMMILICLLALFIGCQQEERTPTEPGILSVGEDTNQIIVSKMKGSEEIVFEDRESIDALQEILVSAIKEEGIVDMAEAEYIIDFYQDEEKQQSLFMWIGEEGEGKGTFMKPEDTHTIYSVSVDVNSTLIELVESRFE
ncbi:hypothetical protein [Alkalicoccobacillus murimartini]|uniref:YhfM-like domain-containing protein n=1 Tax=Alkalicoccobacillus murimartini TaxID=171685 RepID=A0ABT9YJQ5_9BACI|nr:hypothetical protein [Alkalicoccobacillus murimartini]MDQ0207909.1 hypothetical protein [Alkalicoccobacillus murimartini]